MLSSNRYLPRGNNYTIFGFCHDSLNSLTSVTFIRKNSSMMCRCGSRSACRAALTQYFAKMSDEPQEIKKKLICRKAKSNDPVFCESLKLVVLGDCTRNPAACLFLA